MALTHEFEPLQTTWHGASGGQSMVVPLQDAELVHSTSQAWPAAHWIVLLLHVETTPHTTLQLRSAGHVTGLWQIPMPEFVQVR